MPSATQEIRWLVSTLPAHLPGRTSRWWRFSGLLLACWLVATHPGLGQRRLPAQLPAADSSRPVYPAVNLRPLVIQSGTLPARRVVVGLHANLQDATAQPGNQLRIVGMVPVLLTKPLTVLAGFNYLREQGSYSRRATGLADPDTVIAYTRQDVSMSLTAVRQDTLFHRAVTYLATLTGTSRTVGRVEKITAGATALLALRNTPTTRLSAGFTLQFDLSTSLPFVPVVQYWHRFGRSPWELDMLLPQRAHLRRPLLANKCWLSLGTDLMSTHALGSGTVPGLSTTFEANTTSLQTGATFEYRCSPYFMLGIRGGLDNPLTQWVGELNFSQAISKAKAQPAGYVGLVLSAVLPTKKH